MSAVNRQTQRIATTKTNQSPNSARTSMFNVPTAPRRLELGTVRGHQQTQNTLAEPWRRARPLQRISKWIIHVENSETCKGTL